MTMLLLTSCQMSRNVSPEARGLSQVAQPLRFACAPLPLPAIGCCAAPLVPTKSRIALSHQYGWSAQARESPRLLPQSVCCQAPAQPLAGWLLGHPVSLKAP